MIESRFLTVLVTGATGFIGSRLVLELFNRGYDVRQLVRTKKNLGNTRMKSFCVDGLDDFVDLSTPLVDVEVVIHLAARVHVMNEKNSDALAEFGRINVESTLNLARQAASSGVKRFIFVSSIKVNGAFTKKNVPFRADDIPNPSDPYGVSKMEAEFALMQLAKETGMEVVILRPPMVYGPGVKANFLKMIKILDLGIPLPFGNVTNRRSLVFIDNLVDLVIRLIDHPSAPGEIFLVSDGKDVSTTSLLNAVALSLGHGVRLIPLPEGLLKAIFRILGKSDLSDRLLGSLQLDIEKTKKKLDWEPPVPFDRGIKITVNSYLNLASEIHK